MIRLDSGPRPAALAFLRLGHVATTAMNGPGWMLCTRLLVAGRSTSPWHRAFVPSYVAHSYHCFGSTWSHRPVGSLSEGSQLPLPLTTVLRNANLGILLALTRARFIASPGVLLASPREAVLGGRNLLAQDTCAGTDRFPVQDTALTLRRRARELRSRVVELFVLLDATPPALDRSTLAMLPPGPFWLDLAPFF